MLAIRCPEAHCRARAASLGIQLLMGECRFPMIDNCIHCGGIRELGRRRTVCPPCWPEPDDPRKVRLMVIEIRLESLQSITIQPATEPLPGSRRDLSCALVLPSDRQ
jgi:hypothetical protein